MNARKEINVQIIVHAAKTMRLAVVLGKRTALAARKMIKVVVR